MTQTARSKFAAILGALTICVLSGTQADAQDKLPINVGAFQNPNLNIWAPIVAGELGYYAEQGLDAHVEITRPANLMPMLLY